MYILYPPSIFSNFVLPDEISRLLAL